MGIRRGSISTPIIADGLVFNIDAANRASTIPSTSTTTTFNTVDLSQSGSIVADATWEGPTTSSFTFDGTDDHIISGLLDEYISLSAPTSYTVSAWIKTTDNGGAARGIVCSAQYSNGLNFNVFQGEVSFGVSSGTSLATTTTANVNDGNWHQVLGTYNSEGDASGNTLYIYVDGIQKASNTGNRGIYAFQNNPLFIGANAAQSSMYFPLIGKIANTQIYNRTLSANEVLHNYNALKSRFE